MNSCVFSVHILNFQGMTCMQSSAVGLASSGSPPRKLNSVAFDSFKGGSCMHSLSTDVGNGLVLTMRLPYVPWERCEAIWMWINLGHTGIDTHYKAECKALNNWVKWSAAPVCIDKRMEHILHWYKSVSLLTIYKKCRACSPVVLCVLCK